MKTKNQYKTIGFILLIIIISSVYIFTSKRNEIFDVVPIVQNNGQTNTEAKLEIPIIKVENIEKKVEVSEINKIKVFLTILDNKYETELIDGASVIDVMKKIETESTIENPFSFKYTDNASLGSFITEINGEKGSPGKYWIYYINGELASMGVSNYILENGDIINWNQEGM